MQRDTLEPRREGSCETGLEERGRDNRTREDVPGEHGRLLPRGVHGWRSCAGNGMQRSEV